MLESKPAQPSHRIGKSREFRPSDGTSSQTSRRLWPSLGYLFSAIVYNNGRVFDFLSCSTYYHSTTHFLVFPCAMQFTFVPEEPLTSITRSGSATQGPNNFKWAASDTPTTFANGTKAPLRKRTLFSDIPLNKLLISSAQLQNLEDIYRQNVAPGLDDGVSAVDYLYTLGDDDQLAAAAIMAQQDLDVDTRERLDNRWSQQWSAYSTNAPKARNGTRCVLYLWYAPLTLSS